MLSITNSLRLELSLAAILICGLICGLIQANKVNADETFALPGDDKIDWWAVNKFEILEEMFKRENIHADDPDEDYLKLQDIFNDKLAQVKRSGVDRSPRFAKELDAFNMIRYIFHPSLECDMEGLIMGVEQAADRPLTSKMIKYFGARKIQQCRDENRQEFENVKRACENPNSIIEKLPADELVKYIPEGSENVPKASWPSIIGLLFVANNYSSQNKLALKVQCSSFKERLDNYKYATKLANVIKLIAPQEYSEDVMELPKIESIYQRELLCSDIISR